MKTYHEANECGKQITKPCEDCPFRRASLPGWLGASTPAEYCFTAHQDGIIECHTKLLNGEPIQCAGAAIYRNNTCKRVSLPVLTLPKDTKSVFATPLEFLEHHCKKKLTPKKVHKMMHEAFESKLMEMEKDNG